MYLIHTSWMPGSGKRLHVSWRASFFRPSNADVPHLLYCETNTDSKEEERPKLLERGAVGRVQVQDISKITTPQQTSNAFENTVLLLLHFRQKIEE